MTEEIIWVMDSDLCEMCGELLDDWGICPACGYDGVEWEREEDDDDWDDEEVYYVGEYDQELATVPKIVPDMTDWPERRN